MILTCPQCGSRYKLSAEQLGESGRTVKCHSCAETWFQMPDPAELAGVQDEVAALQEMHKAESVSEQKPDDSEDDFPKALKRIDTRDDDELKFKRSRGKMIGYVSALAVFLIILLALIVSKSAMLSAWPSSAAIYKVLGMEVELPGKGLVFDRVQAGVSHTDGGYEVVVSGQLINLTGDTMNIPAIEVQASTSEGEFLGSWVFMMDEHEIKGEGILSFEDSHVLQKEPQNIDLHFLPFHSGGSGAAQEGAPPSHQEMSHEGGHDDHAKTVSEGGDSNPAHSEDGQAHQSGGAEDAGSHGHASSQPH